MPSKPQSPISRKDVSPSHPLISRKDVSPSHPPLISRKDVSSINYPSDAFSSIADRNCKLLHDPSSSETNAEILKRTIRWAKRRTELNKARLSH